MTMPAAGVLCTRMAAAVMIMVAMVMIASGPAAEIQFTLEKGLHRSICIPLHTGIDLDPSLAEGHLRAVANAAADQRIHVVCLQEARQRAVAAAVGIQHDSGRHGAVFYHVQLELGRVSKVLKNLSVFIRDCNSHIFLLHENRTPTTDARLIFYLVGKAKYLRALLEEMPVTISPKMS